MRRSTLPCLQLYKICLSDPTACSLPPCGKLKFNELFVSKNFFVPLKMVQLTAMNQGLKLLANRKGKLKNISVSQTLFY